MDERYLPYMPKEKSLNDSGNLGRLFADAHGSTTFLDKEGLKYSDKMNNQEIDRFNDLTRELLAKEGLTLKNRKAIKIAQEFIGLATTINRVNGKLLEGEMGEAEAILQLHLAESMTRANIMMIAAMTDRPMEPGGVIAEIPANISPTQKGCVDNEEIAE